MPDSTEDAVRELAYRLWEARGRKLGLDGLDLQDWLDAERLIGDSEDGFASPSDELAPGG